MKLEMLTREGKTYRLAIYELGKDPTVISWETGTIFVKVTIPGLLEGEEVLLSGMGHNELMCAWKGRNERRLKEALIKCLKHTGQLMGQETGAKVDP